MIYSGDIALFEPEIAVNTGNIIRLAAALGARLHLIHPLGFTLNDKGLKRAGLDYHDLTCLIEHQSFEHFLSSIPQKVVALSTKAQCDLFNYSFDEPSCLLFGPESRGLPEKILNHQALAGLVKIPQQPSCRSLNLSNAVAISAYEQSRQLTSRDSSLKNPAIK